MARPTKSPRLAGLLIGVLGTGGAFVVQYGLVRDAGATVAATVTYVVPVASTLAGVLILGESPRWNEPAGTLVILIGAALSQLGATDPPARTTAVESAEVVTLPALDRHAEHSHPLG
ncbi:DMT family transporter [Frankia gtarii]|uniref:DMT family transporter n=1 Tax=Frankia gtarii TaxID=2950102 RepID=UPI0021C04AD2|nr:DMT family transporter [Frankia gtarii]